ncbi:MAG: CNNM domain-containing protein [Verrucomicrobiota bacterium]|nr:CNNM domain-containing protein [Verrucomicrobiota bacterium]
MTAILIIMSLLVSFLFAGIEAGILSVNRVRLRHRVKQRDPAAKKLERLLSRPGRVLVTVLIVTNFMNILALTLIVQRFIAPNGGLGYALVGLVCLPFYVLVLELLPKSLFRRFPYRALAGLSEILRLADFLLSPFLNLGSRLTRALFGKTHIERKIFVAREDFKYLTGESERGGSISKAERELIHNVLDFRAVRVKELMLPLAQTETVRPDDRLDTLIERWQRTHHDHLPLLSDSGEIVGLVNVFDVLVDRTPGTDAGVHQRRIVFLKDDEFAYNAIRKLRAAQSPLAAVSDRHSTTLGIVSLEDLVKRLVSAAVPTQRPNPAAN